MKEMRFSLLLFILAVYTIKGQEPAYSHFNSSEGLAGNTVYCGAQDKYGNLWFGTDKGLSRFDGSRFENLGVGDGLPDPEVLDLKADSEGNLWIACFKKNISLRRNGKIYTDKEDSLLSKIAFSTSINNIFEDKSHQKWILGKEYGVYIIRNGELTHKKYDTFLMGLFQIGEELFGIHPRGIYRMSAGGDILEDVPIVGVKEFFSRVFNGYAVSGNKLLISSAGALLFEYDGSSFQLLDKNAKLGGKPFVDHKQQLWLSSPDYGVIHFNPKLKNLKQYKTYLRDKRVNTIVEDSQGGYWFGTIGEGLFRLNANGAALYPLSNNKEPVNISCLATGDSGEILAGDDKGIVYKIKGSKVISIRLSGETAYNKCRQILRTTGSSYWVGTDKGLFKINDNQHVAYIEKPQSIKMMCQRDDTLWIGSANSIYSKSPNDKLPNEIKGVGRTTVLTLDDEHIIWAGGTNGLRSEQQGYKQNWGETFPKLSNRIIALENGNHGTLWAVTPQSGLLKLKIQKGTVLSVEEINTFLPYPISNIQSLFVEPGGQLWLATSQGVYSVQEDYKTQYFGLRDGQPNLDVNSVLVMNDTLWAGTASGLSCLPLNTANGDRNVTIRFSNLRFQRNQESVQVNLSDSLPDNERLMVPKDAKLVELGLSLLDFNGAFDPNCSCSIRQRLPAPWNLTFSNLFSAIKTGFSTSAEYSVSKNGEFLLGIDLPAGIYEIQAHARSKGGNQFIHSQSLLLEKKPYWYETIWFWVLVSGFLAFALYSYIRNRNKIRAMNLQVSELRLHALQAQINPHFIGNSVLAIQQFFYPPDPIKASRYIAILTRLLRKTMEFSDQHFIPFQEEYGYIKDYLDMAQLRFEHRFEYEIESDLDQDLLFPAMLLQPILENATIHGLAKEGKTLVKVRFTEKDGRILCAISDNGVGIEARKNAQKVAISTHKSMGVELIRKKVITLNALYPHHIEFELKDRKWLEAPSTGTLALLSLNKINTPPNTEQRYE